MEHAVRVTVAGSGDAFGTGGRLQTCLHLRPLPSPPDAGAAGAADARAGAGAGADAVLVDCGATALTGLKRLGLEPGEVTVVAVSHLHGDHFGGLPFLILDGQFRRRVRPLHLIGPPGLADRLTRAMETFFPGSADVRRRFEVHVHELSVGGDPVDVAGVSVRGFPVDHQAGAPALGLRVTVAGRTVAYSGDTSWTDVLLDVADGADLFVCEAYTFDRAVRYHLHVPDLLAALDRIRCPRILLTHAGPQVLARRGDLGPGMPLADDGTVVDL
ncbi:MAG TPA: MBL fold metallo-hydrolase [Streptosporangiaceae bacterium]|nr:MBL fold metallo-hydrolase [Streptosporangiaceae bacterium]